MPDQQTVSAQLATFRAALESLPPAHEDAERIDRIRALEALKAAVAAAQARETAAFAHSRRAELSRAGLSAAQADRDVAGQVALARRMSPHQARRYVGFAGVLTCELPETLRVLQRGETSEWRALLVARNTIFLSRTDRAEVDRLVAAELPALGDRRTEALTKQHAYRLDAQATVARASYAENERRVTVRPAPDTMVWLTALLPVAPGVAGYAALQKAADDARLAGDQRGRGQLMADLLVERLLGNDAQTVAVELDLVMTDRALLDPDCADPAWLDGYGPLPAGYARTLALDAPPAAPRWLRRLYTRPDSAELVSMDSRRRRFTPGQRKFLRLRDQHCRTPYCGAPVRHADHLRPSADGGPTSLTNGQGLCVVCNLTKESPGWFAERAAGAAIRTTTPSGRDYLSPARRPPTEAVDHRSRILIDLQWPRAG